MILRQSTAAVLSFGPFVSPSDGVTLQTGLVSAIDHASTGIFLSKAGGALTIRHATVTASTYDAYGNYLVTLDTTDTNTVGRLRIQFAAAASCLPVWMDCDVIEEAVYDALYAGSAAGYQVPIWAASNSTVNLSGTTIATTQKVDVETIKTNPVVNGGTLTFPSGATLASTTNITAGTVTTATNVTTVNGLAAGVITASSIAADAITAAKVADGTIDAATFAAGAINAAAIASDAITDAKVASDVTIASVTGAVGSVTGAVGSVTGAVGSVTAAVTVSGDFSPTMKTSIGTAVAASAVASVTGDVGGNVTGSVGSIATGGIAASSFAAGAIDNAAIAADAIGSSELAASAVNEIADQVWDEVLSGHAGVGSAGAALSAAGGSGDPWSTALPGAYGAGTAGQIVGDFLDAAVGAIPTNAELATALGTADDAVLAQVALVKAKTDLIPASPAAVGDIPTATANADALLNRDMSAVSDTNARSPLNAMRFLRNKWSLSGSTLTVTKENDSTSAWTAAVSTSAGADPIVGSDPA